MSSHERAETDVQCPLRPGEPCALCQVGTADPQDCGLVYLVMHDDELREGLLRHAALRAAPAAIAHRDEHHHRSR